MRHDGNGTFPRNWNLSAERKQQGGIVILSASGHLDANVLGSPVLGADVSEYPLRPCNHEEFDTRVMLHAANAVSHGYKRILIIAGKKHWDNRTGDIVLH